MMKSIILAGCFLFGITAAAADYENFDLPEKATKAPESTLNYTSKRVNLRGSNVRVKSPSFDHQLFFFQKEAFVTEKRDEAIKLLRQEMDSGYQKNRDNMLLRLGQLYSEKYMEMSYRENELFAQELEKRGGKTEGQPLRLDNTRSKRYLKESLDIFYKLEKEYPKHPKIDEIVFFIGFVELESGNGKKGSAYLDRVVRQYPRSRKWDEAVLYLGDYYFDSQKFPEAAAKFKMLAGRDRALRDYAEYKLAWCELNIGSPEKALRQMKALVIRLGNGNDQGRFNLRDQSIKDLVVFYAETDYVDDAVQFFTDRQGKEKAMENLRLIADIYRSKGRDEAAIKAYNRLIAEFGNGPDAPRLYLGLYDSESRLGRSDRAVKHIITAVEKYGANSEWAKSFPPEKSADIQATIETLQAEALKVAFFHHNSGQKSSNKGQYELAMRIYTALLQNFPNHPDRKKIAFFQGEAQYHQGKWVAAANAYLIAARMTPKDKLNEEAAYNALLSVDKLTPKTESLDRYTKEEQKDVDTKPKDIPEAELKFIEVGEFYLQEYPQGQKAVDVQFRMASIYYRYHHFDKAAEGYSNVAMKYPSHKSATTAAHIVLDIYNIRKDYEGLTKTAAVFASVKGLGDAKFRDELAQITSEIDFKQIEPLEKGNKWVEAGDRYFAFFQKNSSGPLAEKSLYNAYVSYGKGEDAVKTSQAANLFISKFPKSSYTTKMVLAQAKLAEKNYDFERAQRLYHDFYKKYPTDSEAVKSLYNSAVFAELLERNKEALSLYDEYLKVGKPDRDEKTAVWVSQAKLYRKSGSFDRMTAMYRQLIREARSFDAKLNYLGELARQYEKAGRTSDKASVLAEISQMAQGRDNSKLGLAAPYVAEAKLRGLSKQREKYASVKLRFPPSDLVYLLKTKEKLLVKLAKAYDGVVDVGVPEWGVAALFEKSQAYDEFVRTFHDLKIPKKYQGEELALVESSLKDIEAKMVLPLEKKSQEILKACADRAAQFKVVSEFAGQCRGRIKGEDGKAVVDVAGLLPQPSYWSTRVNTEGVAKND